MFLQLLETISFLTKNLKRSFFFCVCLPTPREGELGEQLPILTYSRLVKNPQFLSYNKVFFVYFWGVTKFLIQWWEFHSSKGGGGTAPPWIRPCPCPKLNWSNPLHNMPHYQCTLQKLPDASQCYFKSAVEYSSHRTMGIIWSHKIFA